MDSKVQIIGRLVLAVAMFLSTLVFMTSLSHAQTNDDQLVCEVTILRVTPEASKRLFDFVGNDGFVENGFEVVTTDVYSINEKSINEKSAESTPTILFQAPTRTRQITVGKFQQLLGMLEKSSECLVSPGLKTSTCDNKATIGFAGTARPYCVASEIRQGKFGSTADVPVYKVIEDGLIVKHRKKATDTGTTDLSSRIVINQVTEVQTFTFQGVAGPVTIQLPTCKTRQLNISASPGEGQVLLVASDYPENGMDRRVTRNASTIPYVSRLFKNVGIGRGDSLRCFYVISVTQ